MDPGVFGFVFVLVSLIPQPISFQWKICFPETTSRMLHRSQDLRRTACVMDEV